MRSFNCLTIFYKLLAVIFLSLVVVLPSVADVTPTTSAEKKAEFTVILVAVGKHKIQVIKVIRELIGLSLKEAKDLVEAAPTPVKSGLQKAQADEMKKKLEEVGATVEIK